MQDNNYQRQTSNGMKNNNYKIILFLGFFIFSLPSLNVLSAYGQSYYYGQSAYYGESAYYAQSTYYAQGTYNVTFTRNLTVSGNLSITGQLTKQGGGSFAIDHPLDPFNKLLFHSFVESPDVKNIYDGIVALNEGGEATIVLPSYFEALNKDFRYQVKPITSPSPNLHVKQEIKDNKFIIAGGESGTKVSWQVTGIRHDPYILANPIVPEVRKGRGQIANRGEYLLPELKATYEDLQISIWDKVILFFQGLFKSQSI